MAKTSRTLAPESDVTLRFYTFAKRRLLRGAFVLSAWLILGLGAITLAFVQQPTKSNKPSSTQPLGQQETSNNKLASLAAIDLAQLQEKLKGATEPTAGAIVSQLEVEIAPSVEDFADSTENSLVGVGDLDGDGAAEYVLKQFRSEDADATQSAGESGAKFWELFLLSWDGENWRASSITRGFETFEVTVVPSLFAGSNQIALIAYAGTTEIPYPSIYRMKDHSAELVWDGRSDESNYQGYVHGKVEFVPAESDDPPRMVSSGRADPGLIHFPVGSDRGFDVKATYVWDGKAFVAGKTEYSANEDLTLYHFISALHLRDFRSAYALIDPAVFLKTDKPSLAIFRKQIEGSWPEFLDDQVFEVPEVSSTDSNPFQFDLDMESKHYVYQPMFSPGPKFLLVGLERHEGTPADQ